MKKLFYIALLIPFINTYIYTAELAPLNLPIPEAPIEHNTLVHNEQTPWEDAVFSTTDVALLNIRTDQKAISIGIQNCLTNLYTYISSGQISTLKDPAQAKLNLQEMIKLTNDLISTEISDDNIVSIFISCALNKALLNHINSVIQEPFETLDPFDISNIQGYFKELEDNISSSADDYIIALSQENRKFLENLSAKIDVAGLRWYNHKYRWINNNIFEPIKKYDIITRTLGASALISLGFMVWSRMDEISFFSSSYVPNFLKKLVGVTPLTIGQSQEASSTLGALKRVGLNNTTYQRSTGFSAAREEGFEEQGNFNNGKLTREQIINTYGRGVLGRIDTFAIQFAALSIGGGTYVYTKLRDYGFNFFNNESTKILPRISNWMAIKHNTLLGGSYIAYANRLNKDYIEDVRFNNLIGMDHVKNQFKLLIDYIKNPEPYDIKGLTPHKGYLLYGASRAGKSYMVKALCNEIKAATLNSDFKFFEVSAMDINMHGISVLLNLTKNFAPCIIFIDEIDLVGLAREGKNQTLSEFLISMSGSTESKDPSKQVIIIAATNRPETLDHALRREGRFGMQLFCRLPNIHERETAFVKEFTKRGLDPANFNVKQLAAETEGQSYQAISFIVGRSLLKAYLLKELFNQKHIEKTINEDTREILFNFTPQISKTQEQLLATHFAGMALVLSLLDSDLTVSTVTTHPVKKAIKDAFIGAHLVNQEDENTPRYHEYGKIFTHRTTDTIEVATYDDQIKQCTYLMAGIAAEELMFGMPSYTFGICNLNEAHAIAYRLASKGIDAKKQPESIQQQNYAKAMQLLADCKDNAKKILSEHKETLVKMTEQLCEKKILCNAEIQDIIAENEKKPTDPTIISSTVKAA